MKKSELRKIIKEEVIGVLSDVLPSLLAEVVAESQIPPVEQLQESRRFEQTHTTKNQKKPSIAEMIGIASDDDTEEPFRYTSNPMLNDILNQTKGGLPQNANTPAMQMAMDAENASMAELMNESVDTSFSSANPTFGNDFEAKLNRTVPTSSPQPQKPQQTEGTFNPESSTVSEIGDVPMDFIANITRNAKSTLDASQKKGPRGGESNINFEA